MHIRTPIKTRITQSTFQVRRCTDRCGELLPPCFLFLVIAVKSPFVPQSQITLQGVFKCLGGINLNFSAVSCVQTTTCQFQNRTSESCKSASECSLLFILQKRFEINGVMLIIIMESRTRHYTCLNKTSTLLAFVQWGALSVKFCKCICSTKRDIFDEIWFVRKDLVYCCAHTERV